MATAVLVEPAEEAEGPRFDIHGTLSATDLSNNIRNNDGFLPRTRDQLEDRRGSQVMQTGGKVFKEVLTVVSDTLVVSHHRRTCFIAARGKQVAGAPRDSCQRPIERRVL